MKQEQALRLVQSGSTEALAWIIEEFTAYVSTIVTNIIGTYMSTADVEEVTADVFYAFWRHAKQVRPQSLRPYLGTIARNKAKNKLRKAGFHLPLEEEFYISEDLTLEEHCLESELQEAVHLQVHALGEPEREIVVRYYYYCQSICVIAQEMGLTHSNIKIKLHRARNALRAALTPYLSDEGGNCHENQNGRSL